MVFSRRIILIFVLGTFLNSCAGIFAWLTAPEDIVEFPINLKKETSFKVKIDFKTDAAHHIKGMDKIGYYTVAIKDVTLDDEKSKSWKEIRERSGESESIPSHVGKITLKWNFNDGEVIEEVCKGSFGSPRFKSLSIGGFWLPKRQDKQISEVTVTVEKVDTLLADLLKDPKIWIYRGGGK